MRYTNNPVITPQSPKYISYGSPLINGTVDCRDLIVVRNTKKNNWIGFFAARQPAAELAEGSVIAAVESDDLLNWRSLPTAFAPKRFANIEVPDVFYLNGRWYMTLLTCKAFGPRGIFINNEQMDAGTIYAWSDKIEGPYHEFTDDNVLIGDNTGNAAGISCRSVEFKGKRLVFYTQRVPGGADTISPPMAVVTTPEGYLRLAYSPYTSICRRSKLVVPEHCPAIQSLPFPSAPWPVLSGSWNLSDNTYTGASRTGWQICDLGVGSKDLEIAADIQLNAVAGGLVYRTQDGREFVFMLDSKLKNVAATMAPGFPEMHSRSWPINPNSKHRLRIIKRDSRFEVYVDDMLALGFFEGISDSHATIGLFVDRGQVIISNLTAYRLGDNL